MTPHEAFPKIANLIRHIVKRQRLRPDTAEDVIQEAGYLFVRKFDRFDGNEFHLPKFAGWCVGWARRRVLREPVPTVSATDDEGRVMDFPAFDPPPPCEVAEELAGRDRDLAAVRRAVAELPDHWREVVTRGYGLDGRRRETNRQIAARRGVSWQAVSLQRQAAIRRLRSPSELGKKIEALEKPEAKERKATTQAKAGEGKTGGGKLPPPENKGKTRDRVGAALGVSGKTYEKAKQVKAAADAEPEAFGVTGRAVCRHCGREPVTRPRGLGWRCYYTPGVKEQYGCADPARARYARRGIGNTTAAADPTPTSAPPGSPEKLAELERRAESGLSLWHPADHRLIRHRRRVEFVRRVCAT